MSRFCVVEGTKITLNDKETVPIEKIKVGQEILSFNLNTLQKSHKYDTLVKLKTNNFDGIFQEDLVKNVWKNTVDEYYLINDKLKITKDHIVLAKRDQTYYWTKVEQLLLNDYLFTEQNIFEKISSIIIVKEPVKVFNLEVNRVFNYFANSYLIHNGAPCSACLACGLPPITITQNAPGGYKYQVLSGYTTATVTVEGAMGSLHTNSNPEDDPTGCGAIISGSFTVVGGNYIYYFVGGGDGSNFSSIDGSGAGVTGENYNGGGFGAYRRILYSSDINTKHGFKGGGSSFIAYSDSSSLVTINSASATSSNQLEDFTTDDLKKTILVVAGGGGGQSNADEELTTNNSVNPEGGNGGNAEGNSDNSDEVNDVNWITGVTGTFIKGTKGEDNLAIDSRFRRGGEPGNTTSGSPDGGDSGATINGWGGGPHSIAKGSFGRGGYKDSPGGSTNHNSSAISALRGGGGGGGIYGGGAGSLAGGGGGGGLSYYKKTHSGGTVFNYAKDSSGKRNPINFGNLVVNNAQPSANDFNGKITIVLS